MQYFSDALYNIHFLTGNLSSKQFLQFGLVAAGVVVLLGIILASASQGQTNCSHVCKQHNICRHDIRVVKILFMHDCVCILECRFFC